MREEEEKRRAKRKRRSGTCCKTAEPFHAIVGSPKILHALKEKKKETRPFPKGSQASRHSTSIPYHFRLLDQRCSECDQFF